MAYNCLIIDNDYRSCQQLSLILGAHPYVQEVLNTVHPYQINNYLLKREIDIIFIKTRMWEYKMFTAVHALRRKPHVVFLTSCHARYQMDEADTNIDALRQPFGWKDVHEILEGIKNRHVLSFNWNIVFVRYEGHYHKIAFEKLVLIEYKSKSGYVTLYTKNSKLLVKETIKTMLNKLPMEDFVRISDELIIPISNKQLVHDDSYYFEGRSIPLTHNYIK